MEAIYNTDMYINLLRPVTEQDIKEAVFSIGAHRSPGYDGFTAAFYQQFWHVVRGDICSMDYGSTFFRHW